MVPAPLARSPHACATADHPEMDAELARRVLRRTLDGLAVTTRRR
jgi:hypothetical protein